MRVQDVMTRGVKTVPVTATADEAWAQMRLKQIHHLVVMDARAMVGVISDRDIGGRRGAAVRNGRLVRELMTKGVITIEPDAPVRKAANRLRGRSIGCLVVTDRGYVVGIITTADLLDLIGRGAERSVSTGRRWTLSHRVPHRKRHQAMGSW